MKSFQNIVQIVTAFNKCIQHYEMYNNYLKFKLKKIMLIKYKI